MILKAIFASLSVFSLVLFSADVNLIGDDGNQLDIEVQLAPDEATPQIIKKSGFAFSRLPIEKEGFHFGGEGFPELPKLNRWIVVSAKSKYRMEILPGKYKLYKKVILYPAQPDTVETQTPPFKFNKGAYLKNTWYGSRRVVFGKRAQLGELTLLPLSFFPAAYNPRKQELRVYESIQVKLTNLEPDLIEEPTEISQFVAEQAAQLTLNGKRLYSKKIRARARKKLFLVHGPKLKVSGESLADFHRAKGTEVSILEFPTGLKASAFQKIVKEEYQKNKMDAVLILGDEGAVPLQSFGGQVGDFSYGLVAGADQVSDVAVGRLPAKTESQGKMIVNKIERYQELVNQNYLNKRIMLIAHAEKYPGKYTQNMEDVRKGPNPLNLEFNTQYGGEEAKNSTVLDEAQKGYAIINYRGHGSTSSWSSWGSDGGSFSTAQVKALPNEDLSLSFIFNVACNNGAIQNSALTLVERQLFPNEMEDSYQGAVGAFGATAPSLTAVNHRFNFYLFDHLQTANDISIGNIYTLANNELTKDNNGDATSNTKMYVLYSDPLLSPWIR